MNLSKKDSHPTPMTSGSSQSQTTGWTAASLKV